jgi:VanZ family protein
MKILHFWKPVLWLIIILILSLIPGNRLPGIPLFPHIDKAVHAVMYFGLTLLLVRPLSYLRLRRPYAWALLICLTIGILVEISQEYMAVNRSGNWPDVAANLTGTLLGILFYHYLVAGYRWERLV